MSKGNWSFLHEWVIYDYLLARSEEGTLRLKNIISSGQYLGKSKWVKVANILPITNTAFPDINGIKLKGENYFRPAEVKFTTSLFNYHKDKKYQNQFEEFIEQKGFILVASHDHIPDDALLKKYPIIDVFEIEIEGFITFCRENFTRLLNRQIKAHSNSRVWIMYQGNNFYQGTSNVQPAIESGLWCPTENLSGFDLAVGDRILFIKTSGISSQKLQPNYLSHKIIDHKWLLEEIFIAEVKSKIFSRLEYHQYKRFNYDQPLWKNDPANENGWRWNRVFEFKKIKCINHIKKSMLELYKNDSSKNFVEMTLQAFCFNKSRELSQKDYRGLLEVLLK